MYATCLVSPHVQVPGSFLLMEKVLEEYDVYLDCPIISKKEIFRVGMPEPNCDALMLRCHVRPAQV